MSRIQSLTELYRSLTDPELLRIIDDDDVEELAMAIRKIEVRARARSQENPK